MSSGPSHREPEAPPAYTAGGNTGAGAGASDEKTHLGSHPINPNSLTYQLQSHVASVPEQIRASNQARKRRHAVEDSALLEQSLVHQVADFLDEVGSLPEIPLSATLILYPGAAVPDIANLSGLEDMQKKGELVRVVRLEDLVTSAGDNKRNFSDTNGEAKQLWFRDEAQARRLAGYLQPKPKPKKNVEPPPFEPVVPVPPVQQVVNPPVKDKKGWRLRKLLGGSSGKAPQEQQYAPSQMNSSGSVTPTALANNNPGEEVEEEAVSMKVRAEELTFRYENDLGLFESVSGWALVADVTFK